MVIISPAEFLTAAEELSLLHQNEGLNVVTVSDEADLQRIFRWIS